MRRHDIIGLSLAVATAIASAACGGEETHMHVDDSQLEGTWVKSGTHEYWAYTMADHTGVTWDADDDISRAESNLTFSWSIDEDVLTHVFTGAGGNQAVPKVYTITAIDNQSMKWEDDFGLSYVLDKISDQ